MRPAASTATSRKTAPLSDGWAPTWRGRGAGSFTEGGGRAAFAAAEPNFGAIEDIPADPSTEASVEVGGWMTSTINPVVDLDWIRVNLVAGETYLLSMRGWGETPIHDAFLFLYDGNGELVNLDDDGGADIDSLLTFTPDESGVYFLEAGTSWNESVEPEVGEYRIDVRQQGADVPDTFEHAVALTFGEVTFGFIDSPSGEVYPDGSEVDTYSFEAQAGLYYTFEISGGTDYGTEWPALPAGEIDTRAYLYGPDFELIGAYDDIQFPDYLGTRVSFLAEESGTHYLDTLSWAGLTGGYSITAEEIDLSTISPLDAIDWGTQLESNHVKIYFAPAGAQIEDYTSLGWSDYEIGQALQAASQYSIFSNLTFAATDNLEEATFRVWTLEDPFYFAFMSAPGLYDQGFGYFSGNHPYWAAPGALEPGGYMFNTIMHEFGHGLGLAHPHDTSYGSSEVLAGVTDPYTLGLFDLNQGVHTIMSYNDGWVTHPDFDPQDLPIDHGLQGTLAPLDIAVIQRKYGAKAHNVGNDVYAIPTTNGPGTFYSTIWDTGGTDEIAYQGSADAQIDLTAATLDYSPTGGGVMSFAREVAGGFTIANGVVIENASGGGGNDVLVGNEAANRLTGNGGDDVLLGGKGADILIGGGGKDMASYSNATTGVSASLGSDRGTGGAAAGDRYTGIEALEGSKFTDTLQGGNRDDTLSGLDDRDDLDGGNGKDALDGGGGDDRIDGGNHDDRLDGGDGNDRLDGGNHRDTLLGGEGDDLLQAGNDRDALDGGAGADRLDGGNDDDVLNGGRGNDRLNGGNGSDRFVFADLGGTDEILDFRRGQDRIDLRDLDAMASNAGDDAFRWIGSSAFSGNAGELRAYRQGHDYFLAGDVDGDGIADFFIETDVMIARSDIMFI